MPKPDAELVQHVDRNGMVLGMVYRTKMRAKNLCHRAVFVAVHSDDGRLLVHRRAESKDLWPGWWDLAVGGVVIGNESYEVAAMRELDEEIGINGVQLEYLGDGEYHDTSVSLMGRCYRTRSNGPFTYRDGEVEETRLVTPAQFANLTIEYQFVPDSMALVLPHLEEFWSSFVYDGGKPK
ncbi:MAG: NUDIX domain-containing protein [Ilumatobacteraceae bacterium]